MDEHLTEADIAWQQLRKDGIVSQRAEREGDELPSLTDLRGARKERGEREWEPLAPRDRTGDGTGGTAPPVRSRSVGAGPPS